MSNNLTESKKLELKSEMLRHLETAKRLADEGRPSTGVKAFFMEEDIRTLEFGIEPNIKGWQAMLDHVAKQPAIH